MKDFDKNLYLNFLKEARRQTFVLDRNNVKSAQIKGFVQNIYDDGQSRLILLRTGLENTFCMEIGYRGKLLVWNLSCHGHFTANVAIDYPRPEDRQRFMLGMMHFLQKSVGQPSSKIHIRGPERFVDQTTEYECLQNPGTFPIIGTEKIFYLQRQVYEANFCAQWFINS